MQISAKRSSTSPFTEESLQSPTPGESDNSKEGSNSAPSRPVPISQETLSTTTTTTSAPSLSPNHTTAQEAEADHKLLVAIAYKVSKDIISVMTPIRGTEDSLTLTS